MQAFSVFGSDARQTHLAKLLQEAGYPVIHTTDEVRCLSSVLLPVPSVMSDGTVNGTPYTIEKFLEAVPKGTTIWGSGLTPYQKNVLGRWVFLKNYSDHPDFAEKNAQPTAEGALQIAMEQLPKTIHGSHFLVIGYGRIGSRLAAMLAALGGIVTIASRSTPDVPYRVDRTGHYQYPLDAYDAIFNTVPAPIFNQQHCASTREDCLLVDLASSPGGIAKDSGRTITHALGLPAKVAPKTAAEIMLSVILSETEE